MICQTGSPAKASIDIDNNQCSDYKLYSFRRVISTPPSSLMGSLCVGIYCRVSYPATCLDVHHLVVKKQTSRCHSSSSVLGSKVRVELTGVKTFDCLVFLYYGLSSTNYHAENYTVKQKLRSNNEKSSLNNLLIEKQR